MTTTPTDPAIPDASPADQPTLWSRLPKRRLLIIAALVVVGIAFILRTGAMSDYWRVVARLFGGAVLGVALAGIGVRRLHGGRLRSAVEGIAVSTFTLIFLLLGLEVYFKLFVAMPDANDKLLASQNWFERYWTPINSLGYRDVEWTREALGDRTQIVVLGDSFAAGHGISDIHNRFSGVLASDLGDHYAVMTVADLGWPTSKEAQALAEMPYKPDWVILSYYINDIEDLADDFDAGGDSGTKGMYRAPDIVKQSYLLNYVYFRGLRLPMFEQSNATSYVDFLEALYTNPETWAAHSGDLRSIADWCAAHQARLLVVVFPSLVDPASTDFATERVTGLFRNEGIPVLEVEALIDGWEPGDLVVNRFDAHPSEKLSAALGHALSERIRALEVEP
jgi:hypothetical protein